MKYTLRRMLLWATVKDCANENVTFFYLWTNFVHIKPKKKDKQTNKTTKQLFTDPKQYTHRNSTDVIWMY
jgi:hypothetical protein